MDKIIMGIDLGATYSAVAYVDNNGTPTVINNEDGKTTTPSVVRIKDGATQVGEIALNQWILDEEHVVRWIKRSMGDDNYRFQGMSPIEVSAEIIKSLKKDAERHFGCPVYEAVITCPAYFTGIEVENTRKAGELAGFQVREVIKEPTAAAVYYGVEHMEEDELVVVCDLGGGTYDASIIQYKNDVFDPLASCGSRECGGHDWTRELFELAADRFLDMFNEDPRNDLVVNQKLYEDCEKAKRDYERRQEVIISCPFQGRIGQITVTRDEFEGATEYLIEKVVGWTEEALQKGNVTWDDINKILLVGGSSRLRRFSEALEQCSGKKPELGRKPDLMVVLGAAIIAAGRVRTRKSTGGLRAAPRGGLAEVTVYSGGIREV